jgi:transglutaminase/protease-like cytokinesis protein 3
MDQCHAGVCRHRSLLFKLLGDEAGLKTALVRGNFIKKKPPGFAHAWNEVILEDGRHLLVDVMHNGGAATFRELTDPYVIKHYGRVDDTPWYGGKKAGE